MVKKPQMVDIKCPDACLRDWEANDAVKLDDFEAIRRVFLAKKNHISTTRLVVGEALEKLKMRRPSMSDDGA